MKRRVMVMELVVGQSMASIDGGRVQIRVQQKTGSNRVRLVFERDEDVTISKEYEQKPVPAA
ncbi:MAG: hypothetical protein QM762_08805 [Chryseolinea sp.]